MRKILLVLVVILVGGGFLAWKQLQSEPENTVDPELAEKAIADGSAAGEIALPGEVEFEPRTLTGVRALLGDDALAQARERLESYLQENPAAGEPRVLLAEVLRRQGDLDGAQKHSEAALERLPAVGRAHWVHSMILRGQLEKLGSSGNMGRLKALKNIGPYRSALRTAIELDPNNVDARKEEVLFYLYTPGIGDAAKGLELAQEILAVDEMQGELTMARALYKNDQAEEGFERARKAIERFPDSTEPTWILGSLYYEDKQYAKADPILAQVMEGELRDETYYQVLYRRMRVNAKLGEGAEETLAFAEEYLEADPKWEWAPEPHRVWCEKGRALGKLDRKEEARAALKKSLELAPTYERAQKLLTKLD